MDNLLKNLITNIRKLLQFNNMSNDQFASIMDYTLDDVERILSGELLLPPRELIRIANIFGITYRELLSNDLKLNNE